MPPSPLLSARIRNRTYLPVTVTISAQTISETTPTIWSGRSGPSPTCDRQACKRVERAGADIAEHHARPSPARAARNCPGDGPRRFHGRWPRARQRQALLALRAISENRPIAGGRSARKGGSIQPRRRRWKGGRAPVPRTRLAGGARSCEEARDAARFSADRRRSAAAWRGTGASQPRRSGRPAGRRQDHAGADLRCWASRLRGGKRILLLEPRRLAARAAAARMAATLGERVGETIGLRVRMQARVSASTRIEVVTEGVFTRMILDDPALDGRRRGAVRRVPRALARRRSRPRAGARRARRRCATTCGCWRCRRRSTGRASRA